MPTSLSSVSHYSGMKVMTLVKSLVLVILLFLSLGSEAVTSPVQVQCNMQELACCYFPDSDSVNAVSDLFSCMNELAKQMGSQRRSGKTEARNGFFLSKRDDHYRPNGGYRGPLYSGNRPGSHRYPPALPPGYPVESTSNYNPGILGVNLLDALSSISQYDDRKCVPRILCEIATGVIPGNSEYKQSYGGNSFSSLISLVTAFDTGESSPLLTFGKSALMGYTNRGNPDVCYRQYPKCPRDPRAVVDYLNNYNGGFFRFFRDRDSSFGYRAAVNNRPPSPQGISGTASDRRGTGNLKFDIPSNSPRVQLPFTLEHRSIFPETPQPEKNRKVVFPEESSVFSSLSRTLKYDEPANFFPPVETKLSS